MIGGWICAIFILVCMLCLWFGVEVECAPLRGGFFPKDAKMISKIKSDRHWFDNVCKVVDIKRKVDVYRNLNRDCWSVRQGARVVCHTDYITLKDCEFIVQPAGRRRVLIEQKKKRPCVCAWIPLQPSRIRLHASIFVGICEV